MNTQQGSIIVLGNNDALDIPADIKGRGIWSFGNKNLSIQAPFITTSEIVNQCKEIRKEFDDGKREVMTPLIEMPDKSKEGVSLRKNIGQE